MSILIWITIGARFISDANSLCHENNGLLIDDKEKCSLAVSDISNQRPNTEFDSDWPRGCYITNKTKKIYFNSHFSGRRNAGAQPLCISKTGSLNELSHYFTFSAITIKQIIWQLNR